MKYAVSISMAGLMAMAMAMATPTEARAGVMQWNDNFEFNGNGGWWFAGNAGIDHGIGLAHWGANNGWVRNWTGWNAVNTEVSTRTGRPCVVGAWIRTSSNLTDGYMSIRSWRDGLPIIAEIRLPVSTSYSFQRFEFTGDADSALFYVGLWGNGTDQWIQVDDVVVQCTTPY
jgi:hypothetical protein